MLDQRHRLVVGYVWELAADKKFSRALDLVAGGWSLGGVVTLASGFPVNVLQSGDTWNNDALWPRPNLVPGQSPMIDDRTPTRWFNTDAFSRSTTYGTSPRNPIVGPGLHTFDLVGIEILSDALPRRTCSSCSAPRCSTPSTRRSSATPARRSARAPSGASPARRRTTGRFSWR